jgi:lactoylglutathione lyase
MAELIQVSGLFETHLTVSDLQRSIVFYRDVIGLELGIEVPERNCAFFWVGGSKHSMLGLWSMGSIPNGLKLHIAFKVNINDLFDVPRRLRSKGISPLDFFGQETDEPTVICWMPAASVFFRDPDDHLIEYLAILDEEPRPHLRVIPWSDWIIQKK